MYKLGLNIEANKSTTAKTNTRKSGLFNGFLYFLPIMKITNKLPNTPNSNIAENRNTSMSFESIIQLL